MNAPWQAAEALLALAVECLGDDCSEYERQYVDVSRPVADCSTLAVVIGRMTGLSSSCVGKMQYTSPLEVHLIRCCEPVGELAGGGYQPPSPEEVQAAAACLTRDAWSILNCIVCSGCEAFRPIQNVEACCDENSGIPSIDFSEPSGGCRSAVISLPVTYTLCCDDTIPD